MVLGFAWGRELAGGFVGVITLLLATSTVAAVPHAEVVAHRVREPYGSIVLAAVVTVIDVALVVALTIAVLRGAETLAHDCVQRHLGLSLLFGARSRSPLMPTELARHLPPSRQSLHWLWYYRRSLRVDLRLKCATVRQLGPVADRGCQVSCADSPQVTVHRRR